MTIQSQRIREIASGDGALTAEELRYLSSVSTSEFWDGSLVHKLLLSLDSLTSHVALDEQHIVALTALHSTCVDDRDKALARIAELEAALEAIHSGGDTRPAI